MWHTNLSWASLGVLFSIVGLAFCQQGDPRFGYFLGPIQSYHHGVQGELYAVDSRTLHLRNFQYDGQGPAAFFWVGSGNRVGQNGYQVPDEGGSLGNLRGYRGESVTITLPEGKTLDGLRYFSVWCKEYDVNFGDVFFQGRIDYPKPKKIDDLQTFDHDVTSGRIVVVDTQTFLIPNFTYDGQAPDAYFWVGKGRPSPQGIRVPDENGGLSPLKAYRGKTIVITLPDDVTVYDIDYLSVWCEEYAVNFAEVTIPKSLNVPPSLRMLGVAPQRKYASAGYAPAGYPLPSPPSRTHSSSSSEENRYQPPIHQGYVAPSTYRPPTRHQIPPISLRNHGVSSSYSAPKPPSQFSSYTQPPPLQPQQQYSFPTPSRSSSSFPSSQFHSISPQINVVSSSRFGSSFPSSHLSSSSKSSFPSSHLSSSSKSSFPSLSSSSKSSFSSLSSSSKSSFPSSHLSSSQSFLSPLPSRNSGGSQRVLILQQQPQPQFHSDPQRYFQNQPQRSSSREYIRSSRSKPGPGLTSLTRSQDSNSYSIDTGSSRSSFTIYTRR